MSEPLPPLDLEDGPAGRILSVAREMLLRVPGLGSRAVDRILAARRHARLRADLAAAERFLVLLREAAPG